MTDEPGPTGQVPHRPPAGPYPAGAPGQSAYGSGHGPQDGGPQGRPRYDAPGYGAPAYGAPGYGPPSHAPGHGPGQGGHGDDPAGHHPVGPPGYGPSDRSGYGPPPQGGYGPPPQGGYGPPPQGGYGPPPQGGYGPPPQGGYGPPPQGGYGPDRYGPPGSHGPALPGPYGPGQPGPYGPGPHAVPASAYRAPGSPAAPRRRRAGRVALIVVAVVVGLLAVGGYLLYRQVSSVLGGLTGGGSLADAGVGCSFVRADDVSAVLGGTYDLVELGGLGGVAAPVLDSRVLAKAPTCWGLDEAAGKLVRIARYSGADAAAVFTHERTTAMGTSQDQGNGITLSSEGYYGKDVAAGDEAFCTTGDFTSAAGALVRTGERLVYVSTTAAGQGAETPPQIQLSGDRAGFATDEENCRLAVTLAAKVT